MKKDDHTPEALGRFLAGRYHDAATQYGGERGSATPNSCVGWAQADYGAEPAGIGARHTGKVRGTWKVKGRILAWDTTLSSTARHGFSFWWGCQRHEF